MKDSSLRLQDKTIFLAGPFNGVTQAILRTFTEFGADVAYVCKEMPYPAKYVESVNEAREAHPEYGRAAHFEFGLDNERDIQDAMARVVETLGRMDVLIDASPLAWDSKTDIPAAIQKCEAVAQQILPFLVAKMRGRILYFFEDAMIRECVPDPMPVAGHEAVTDLIQRLSRQGRTHNITANGASLGITDDALLKAFPRSTSLKKSFEELKQSHPDLKLVGFTDVALGAAFLTSAMSASVTGQILRLTH